VAVEAQGEKEYKVQPRPVLGVFAPKCLALSAARGGVLQLAPLVEAWCEEVEAWAKRREQEEIAEAEGRPVKDEKEPLPPFPDIGPAFVSMKWGVARDVVVQAVRRGLEQVCARVLGPREAWKLLKDAPLSVRRKVGRSRLIASRLRLGFLGGRAGARGHVVPATAEMLVSLLGCWWEPPGRRTRRASRGVLQFALSVSLAGMLCGTVAFLSQPHERVSYWCSGLSLMGADALAYHLASRLLPA